MSADSPMDRPAQLMLGLKMLYLVVGIGIIRTSMTVLDHLEVRSPYFLIATKFLVYAVGLYLIYQTGKGRNWARWALLVVLSVGIPLSVLPSLDAIAHSPVHTGLGILQLLLYLGALVLLFHRTVTAWFKDHSPAAMEEH